MPRGRLNWWRTATAADRANSQYRQDPAMTYETLEVKQDGAIAWLTLNRPHVLNALNSAMVSELHDYFERLACDRITRVVVVRGAGRGFCAGLDLKEHSGARPGDDTLGSSTSTTLEIQRRISGLIVAIRRLPQP